jgi:hypothetical protein
MPKNKPRVNLQRAKAKIAKAVEVSTAKVVHALVGSKGKIIIRPSTDDEFASIDLTSIDHSFLEEAMKKLKGVEQKKIKVNLYIEENEAISPEARTKVTDRNTLNTST